MQAWRRTQMHYALISNALGKGRVPFRLVTRRALDLTLDQTGDELDEAARQGWSMPGMSSTLGQRPTPCSRPFEKAVTGLPSCPTATSRCCRALADRLETPFDAIYSGETAGRVQTGPGHLPPPLRRPGARARRHSACGRLGHRRDGSQVGRADLRLVQPPRRSPARPFIEPGLLLPQSARVCLKFFETRAGRAW